MRGKLCRTALPLLQRNRIGWCILIDKISIRSAASTQCFSSLAETESLQHFIGRDYHFYGHGM